MSAPHTISVRVYYEDTDFSGIVYHANYLKYFERGRTEALRSFGYDHRDLFQQTPPLAFAVRSMDIQYKAPARMDDLLSVETLLISAKGARMLFTQRVLHQDTLLAEAKVEVACMDLNGRARRIPADMLAALSAE